MRAQNLRFNFAMWCAAYVIVLPIAIAILPYPSLCVVIVMASLTAAAVYATHLMVKEIEGNYPDLYRDIGRPRLFSEQSFGSQLCFVDFILRRKYSSVSNAKIKRDGDIVFASRLITLAMFVYLLVFRYQDFHGSGLGP